MSMTRLFTIMSKIILYHFMPRRYGLCWKLTTDSLFSPNQLVA